MDANNYVGTSGNGYVVVKNGQIQGTYASQAEAEQAYNGSSDGSGGVGGGYDAGGGTSTNVAADQVAINAANMDADRTYKQWLASSGNDRLAFEKATEAWHETFSQGQANNTNALDWLGLATKMSGPANAFEYAKLLTGTPGGLADIVRAAGGAYRLPAFGGGASGTPVPLSIDSIIKDLNAYAPTGSAPPASTGPAGTYQTINGTKTVAQMASELKVAGWSGNPNDANAVAAAYGSTSKGTVTPNAVTPAAAPSVTPTTSAPVPNANIPLTQDSTWTPAPTTPAPTATAPAVTPAAVTPTATTPAPTGGYIPSYGPLPTSGNQFAPQNMAVMDPSQRDLLGATYGNAGYNWQDLLAQYSRSLRAYGGPSQGSAGF